MADISKQIKIYPDTHERLMAATTPRENAKQLASRLIDDGLKREEKGKKVADK